MTRWVKLINGIEVDMTAEEISARQAEEQNWENNKPSKFNIAMENLRAKRNNLLAETDYYALSDQTLSDDMRTYRQDLRNITEGLTTVEEVETLEFPTKPL
tara:strand:+ start:513 stop:815 length:303 start_codon:yes stop_codon:yes gene_type:complete